MLDGRETGVSRHRRLFLSCVSFNGKAVTNVCGKQLHTHSHTQIWFCNSVSLLWQHMQCHLATYRDLHLTRSPFPVLIKDIFLAVVYATPLLSACVGHSCPCGACYSRGTNPKLVWESCKWLRNLEGVLRLNGVLSVYLQPHFTMTPHWFERLHSHPERTGFLTLISNKPVLPARRNSTAF